MRPDLGGPEVLERPVEPPERSFLTGRVGPVPPDVVPPFEFPALP